jgi:peptidoglycan/LPS O-acetylase OafA/YrhL
LWQQIFFNPNSNSLICAFPYNLIATCVAALASYLVIECPFLRWRERWRVTKDLHPPAATQSSFAG